MIIHMLRHGDTEATERHLYYGSTDLPVTEAGAEHLREMRSKGGYPAVGGLKVYTSGMLRTEQTLELLYGDVPHEALTELREMEFGEFEMHSYEELCRREDYIEWISGDNMANRCPGGESGNDFAARVLREFKNIEARGEDCLLVVHGGVISCIMEYLFPGERAGRYDWQPKPGCGYTVTITPRRVCRSELPDEKPAWMDKGYSFFQNRACEYFPCHKTARTDDFSCMFCYCPLFALGEECGGNFRYTKNGDKDCSGCIIPHMRENFGHIIGKYPLIRQLAAKKNCKDR